jgi:succinate dehydrogenase/fumarate reductase flavoprotein subunit
MWGGERAGRSAAAFAAAAGPADPGRDALAAALARSAAPRQRRGGTTADAVLEALQRCLFPYDVCLLKRARRLAQALATVEALRDAEVPRLHAADGHELAKAHETANLVRVAEMFLRASLARTESRGDHFREDHPRTDQRAWLRWVTLRQGDDGRMQLDEEPVPLASYPLQPPADEAA